MEVLKDNLLLLTLDMEPLKDNLEIQVMEHLKDNLLLPNQCMANWVRHLPELFVITATLRLIQESEMKYL